MKPYSNDLRRRIVEAYENNEYSQQQMAELFGVSPATVRNLVHRQRETGTTDAWPHAGGKKPSLNEKARRTVEALIKQQHDATLAEVCQRVERKHKKKISLATMSRWLQRLGLPRKKSRSTLWNETRPESSKRVLIASMR
jgi:transposase